MRTPFSTDFWYERVCRGREEAWLEERMLDALKREVPSMCSVTFERACNLQCLHCIYPAERSSEHLSHEAGLSGLVSRAVEQLPGDEPRLLHEGRIIRPWHVEAMAEAARRRPDLRLGLLDNGTYLRSLKAFDEQRLRLDWLDISLDGPEEVHNRQRASLTAFRDALVGLERAREILKPSGRLTSLYTVTEFNHASIEATADILFGRSLVDQWHVTTLSPARREIASLERMDLREFWVQAQRAFHTYGHNANGEQRVFFRFYRHQELLKLAEAVGYGEVAEAFEHGVRFAPGEIHLTLQDVPIVFSPLSLWPGETFLIDADGTFRTAYSISKRLTDLRRGHTRDGEDVRGFSVERLRSDFDLVELHHKCVEQWWKFRGHSYLEEEADIFRRLRA